MAVCVSRGEGVWAKKLKPSYRGLVSGATRETVMEDGGEGWCGAVVKLAVVWLSH